jgi:hypothetical protein
MYRSLFKARPEQTNRAVEMNRVHPNPNFWCRLLNECSTALLRAPLAAYLIAYRLPSPRAIQLGELAVDAIDKIINVWHRLAFDTEGFLNDRIFKRWDNCGNA